MTMSSIIHLRLQANEHPIIQVKATAELPLGKYNTASQEFIYFQEPIRSVQESTVSK